MKIVVLDGYALNPGDLSWDPLHELGETTVYERTPVERVVERSRLAKAILTNKTPITREALERLPALRYIGVLATGYNVVDVAAAQAQGIVVTNVPDYGTHSVAQHTIALLLELCGRIGVHSEAVHAGEWTNSPDWCFTKAPLTELFGKTMGIIGHGQIGRQVGRIALALGMKVVCVKRSHSPAESLYGETYAALPDLLAEADVISLHCPLTKETEGLINRANIARMKNGAVLLNTARGALVAEADLAEALNEGRLAGAGLDVLSLEPPNPDNPLLRARNCLVTPHVAWATREARSRLLQTAVDNVRAYRLNKPVNVVQAR